MTTSVQRARERQSARGASWPDQIQPGAVPSRRGLPPSVELCVVSFLILFLEMSLIRWISTEIRIFAYVNNLVLLACFLGIGLGCFAAARPARLWMSLLSLSLLLLLIVAPLRFTIQGRTLHLFKDVPTLLSWLSDSMIWYHTGHRYLLWKTVLGLGATLVVFALIIWTFVPLGQLLGKLLNGSGNILRLYSLNVLASLAGIWCFNLLSFGYQPPWVWFLIAWLGFAWLVWSARLAGARTVALLGGLLVLLGCMAIRPVVDRTTAVWSPYQKLQVHPLEPQVMRRGYMVTVNDVGFMTILNLSDRFIEAWPGVFDVPMKAFSQYNLPYQFTGPPEAVLIIGAGGGNDVAGALRNGARRVTAIEIDPGICRISRALHPEAPYFDPRVRLVIDDARSFLKRSTDRFDVICFGTLDAHTLASTYNNVRIDHYVYTLESFREARRLLKPGGLMAVIFSVQRDWIADRIAGLLYQTFGQEPLVFTVRSSEELFGWGGVLFIAGDDMARIREVAARDPSLRTFIERNALRPRQPVTLTTDDWPYLYLQAPQLPALYGWLSVLLLGLYLAMARSITPGVRRIDWHFFFLGAGFLLLEFQNISKTSLLFGSTWLVNAFTISAILVLILLANAAVSRLRWIRLPWVAGCLIASIAALYALPLELLNGLPLVPRIVVSGLLLNLPILFAGVVFVTSLRQAADAGAAFGSNLLGACVGGLLESFSFLAGIHVLVLLVGALYLGAMMTRKNWGQPVSPEFRSPAGDVGRRGGARGGGGYPRRHRAPLGDVTVTRCGPLGSSR